MYSLTIVFMIMDLVWDCRLLETQNNIEVFWQK